MAEKRTWKADYWRPPFMQGRDNRDENPRDNWDGPDEPDPLRAEIARDAIWRRNSDMGTTRAVFYSQPLGRTYLDGDVMLNHEEAVNAAHELYFRLSAKIRDASRNRPSVFLKMLETPAGRLKLINAGLVLLDDEGEIVNALGERINEAVNPADRDADFWNPPKGNPRERTTLGVYGAKKQ